MHKILLPLIIMAMLPLGCSKEDSDSDSHATGGRVSRPDSIEVTVITGDSLTQKAWFIPTDSRGHKEPLIVTLPMLNKTHESFAKFVDEVRAYVATSEADPDRVMPNFLNLDLRGHGQSTLLAGQPISFMSMGDENFVKIPQDVDAMIRKVLTDYAEVIDSSYIVVVGASIGANGALMVTEMMPEIRKVVALSPGRNYRGMQPLEAFKAYGGEVLFVACQGDEYSLESTRELVTSKDDGWFLKLYFGSDHGTRIINNNGIAMSTVIKWIYGDGIIESDPPPEPAG